MSQLDPGRHWLAAGITGLARQREWDATATVEAPGAAGDDVEFVVLPDGRILVESGPVDLDLTPLTAALESSIEAPYRALGLRRPELWALGARRIETEELVPDPRGDQIELVRDEEGTRLRIDGMPALERVPALERLGEAKSTAFVVRAERLVGALFEVAVEPL
jgi:hypothetical protein